MNTASTTPGPEHTVFNLPNQRIPGHGDKFAGALGEGWSWLRENPDGWRIRDGGLEICVEPGVAETVRNALVREAPDRSEGTFAIEVTVSTGPPSVAASRDGRPENIPGPAIIDDE